MPMPVLGVAVMPADKKRPRALVRETQIAKGELEPLGKEIAARLEKMRGYEATAQEKAGVELKKADDHWNSITQLLTQAKKKCDEGGFKAFKEKYCPNLSRSRIYELLTIGSGKKTLEESRAKNAEANRRHRSKRRASPSRDGQTGVANGEAIASPSVTPSDAPVHHKAVNAEDIALREFNEHVLRLLQMTAKAKATRFAATAVPAEQLNKLSAFLQAVANSLAKNESPAASAPLSDIEAVS
jgi:hypothetical protein